MIGENEKSTEVVEDEKTATVDKAEKITEDKAETAENEKEEKSTQEEFISEFAPEPIKIPNYNKEKEMLKRAKVKEKGKKLKSKKSRRRRKIIEKTVAVARNILLFVVLFVVITATVSTLFVKMNTSEYSVRKAIRSAEPETFIVGEVKNPAKINLRPSAKKASVADVLRDNSMLPVTYADIQGAVMRSTYPDFVAGIAHEMINYYMFGETYNGVTVKEISGAILENASHIKVVTNMELGESACREISEYVAKSEEFKSLSPENIQKQKVSGNTHITTAVFSTASLICYVIALLLFMILAIIFCKGYAYKLIGWAAIASGAITSIVGFLIKPGFEPRGEFVKSVFNAIVKSFHQSVLVFGGVTVLVGILVILIGSAIEEEDDDEYEDEYIDEIEQVLTEE